MTQEQTQQIILLFLGSGGVVFLIIQAVTAWIKARAAFIIAKAKAVEADASLITAKSANIIAEGKAIEVTNEERLAILKTVKDQEAGLAAFQIKVTAFEVARDLADNEILKLNGIIRIQEMKIESLETAKALYVEENKKLRGAVEDLTGKHEANLSLISDLKLGNSELEQAIITLNQQITELLARVKLCESKLNE